MALGKLHIAAAFGTDAGHVVTADFGRLVEVGAEEAQTLFAPVPPDAKVAKHATQRKQGV